MSHLFRTVLGIIGDIVSSGLFLAPMFTFHEMIRSGAVRNDYSAVPYCAILLNCVTWLIYGLLLKNSTTILVVNCIGIGFEALYLITAFIYAARRIRIHILVSSGVTLICMGVTSMLVFLGGHTSDARTRYAGITCVISGVAMYGSTIPQMIAAYRTRQRDSMPLLIVVGLLSTGIWLLYGIMFHDLYMMIQDSCGLLLCAIQMVVYIIIPRLPAPAPA